MSRLHSDWRETPVDALPPRYYTRIEGAATGAYRELLEPPALDEITRLSLVRQIEGFRAMAHLHAPGDGWHYLPSRAEYVYNGSYWFGTLATSEGPVLANVLDLCRELGISYAALYRSAYPDEGRSVPKIAREDRDMRTRSATLKDARKLLADLESVNYHSLRGALEDALRKRHIPT
jgi:hypothetical protein